MAAEPGSADRHHRARRGWKPHLGAVVVLLIGLVITATLSIGTEVLRNENEDRLLRQRVHEAAAVAVGRDPERADSAGVRRGPRRADQRGDPARSSRSLGPAVDDRRSRRLGLALAVRTTPDPQLDHRRGREAAAGAAHASGARAASSTARPSAETFVVRDHAREPPAAPRVCRRRRPTASTSSTREASLPRTRRVARSTATRRSPTSTTPVPGPEDRPDAAHGIQRRRPRPARGTQARRGGAVRRHAAVHRPRAAIRARRHVARRALPWVLAAVGIVLTLAAAALAEWLIRRRERAEALAAELEKIAAENARLLADQRTVAYDPAAQPAARGAARRRRARARRALRRRGRGRRHRRRLVRRGDAWTTGACSSSSATCPAAGCAPRRSWRRCATRSAAYAAQGDDPATVLTKLTKLLSVGRDGALRHGAVRHHRRRAATRRRSRAPATRTRCSSRTGRPSSSPTRNGVPVGVSRHRAVRSRSPRRSRPTRDACSSSPTVSSSGAARHSTSGFERLPRLVRRRRRLTRGSADQGRARRRGTPAPRTTPRCSGSAGRLSCRESLAPRWNSAGEPGDLEHPPGVVRHAIAARGGCRGPRPPGAPGTARRARSCR